MDNVDENVIIKGWWYMLKNPYPEDALEEDSPKIDKATYDAISTITVGVAIQTTTGKKYIALRDNFDNGKIERGDYYIYNKWKKYDQ